MFPAIVCFLCSIALERNIYYIRSKQLVCYPLFLIFDFFNYYFGFKAEYNSLSAQIIRLWSNLITFIIKINIEVIFFYLSRFKCSKQYITIVKLPLTVHKFKNWEKTILQIFLVTFFRNFRTVIYKILFFMKNYVINSLLLLWTFKGHQLWQWQWTHENFSIEYGMVQISKKLQMEWKHGWYT